MRTFDRQWWAGVLVVAGLACATQAAAETFNVKGVEVREGEGELAVEMAWQDRFPVNSNFIRQSYKIEYSYGFADWFKAGVELNLEQHVGDRLEAKTAGVETQFVMLQPDKWPIGLAWFTRYDLGVESEESDVLTFGPLVSFDLDPKLKVTLNPLFEREWSPTKPGLKLDYAWQLKAEVAKHLGLGVEGYGEIPDIGDPPALDYQEHRAGPVAYFACPLAGGTKNGKLDASNMGGTEGSFGGPKIELQFGVLFGLTEATADIAYKTKLALTF